VGASNTMPRARTCAPARRVFHGGPDALLVPEPGAPLVQRPAGRRDLRPLIACGDIDGDGIDDLPSAPANAVAGARGRVFVFRGGARRESPSAGADVTLAPEAAADAGRALLAMNGDGRVEIPDRRAYHRRGPRLPVPRHAGLRPRRPPRPTSCSTAGRPQASSAAGRAHRRRWRRPEDAASGAGLDSSVRLGRVYVRRTAHAIAQRLKRRC
jgi:hypothetical protein